MPKPRSKTLAMIWRCARHQDPEIQVEYIPYGNTEPDAITYGTESLAPSDRGVTGARCEESFWA